MNSSANDLYRLHVDNAYSSRSEKREVRLPSEPVVVRCQRCRGTGQEVIVSFFSPELAQDVNIPCRTCGGKGFVRESEQESKGGSPSMITTSCFT